MELKDNVKQTTQVNNNDDDDDDDDDNNNNNNSNNGDSKNNNNNNKNNNNSNTNNIDNNNNNYTKIQRLRYIVRKVLETKLNSGNVFKGINTWAVSGEIFYCSISRVFLKTSTRGV